MSNSNTGLKQTLIVATIGISILTAGVALVAFFEEASCWYLFC